VIFSDPVAERLNNQLAAEKAAWEHELRGVGGEWIGAGEAGHLAGQLVTAHTVDGRQVAGTLNEDRGTVTDIMGNEHAVTEVKPRQAEDWRSAIDQYDQDVRTGRIRFGPDSPGAEDYPGKPVSDASLNEFMRTHVPPA